MQIRSYETNPIDITLTLSLSFITLLMVLTIIYLLVRPKNAGWRITGIYLSGEGEEVVKSHTPSPMNLYWSIMKRFFKSIYRALLERMHTGNFMDWINFMSSWFGVLILISIVFTILTLITR